ncbi:MAG: hypothetical protein ACPGUD_03100 [Parashewanella sp.]
MLKAILHGKSGRINGEDNQPVSWSNLFKTREDLLTSTFFERFAYLSINLQKQILTSFFSSPETLFRNAIQGLTELGDFISIDYWPHFSLQDENRKFVEPDLILKFTHADILIEVKPPAGGYQNEQQWRTEINGYIECNENTKKALYFLALGQTSKITSSTVRQDIIKKSKYELLLGVAAIEWQFIADRLVELTTLDNNVCSIQDIRILNDMLDALKLYGIRTSKFTWDKLLNSKLPKLKPLDQYKLAPFNTFNFNISKKFLQLSSWSQQHELNLKAHSSLNKWKGK